MTGVTVDATAPTARDDAPSSADPLRGGPEDSNTSSIDNNNNNNNNNKNAYKGGAVKMDDSEVDKIMDASAIINSMRSAVGDSLRNLEPPMPLFTKPRQRQHWGDIQETPHKEWGDIFFDLFYVAGAYNLGTLLREEPTLKGLFYFAAVFFPVQALWQYKMYYDARFYTLNDMWHNLYNVATLVSLGSAVLHIRPVALLSDPEHNNDLFIFCASICAGMFLIMGRLIEVIFLGEGKEAAIRSSKRETCMYGIMTLFYASATIYSGIAYYAYDGDGGGTYGDDYHYDTNSTSIYNTTTNDLGDFEVVDEDDLHVRFLAGASNYDEGEKEDSAFSGDVAMGLMLGGFCFNHVFWYFYIAVVAPRLDGGDFRKSTVPMNIDYAIHRYGEWIMLMLGETVLSLLIVGVKEQSDYYKTFYSGILSISMLEYMHFRSQPHHADEHAMRRNKTRGYAYLMLFQLFSAALIILGASYKMLLYEFIYTDDGDGADDNEAAKEDHRRMLFAPNTETAMHRWLAGGGGGALLYEPEDRQQRSAHLFCGSLAAVFLLSDLLIIVHKGIKEHMDKCKNNQRSKAAKLLGLPLTIVRIAVIVFMATLSQYTTDGSLIAFVGLVCIVVELMLRVVGTALFKEETEEDEAYQEMIHHGIDTKYN